MTGINRNLEEKIRNLLEIFPVVLILGARQVGKTTLAKQVASSWKHIDLEDPADFDQISQNIKFFFQRFPQHVFIDEAQEYPQLFQYLRVVVDQRRDQKGRFILTGSSNPELLSQASETLAGRVGIVELSTLKVNEYYQKPLSAFYTQFQSKLKQENVVSGKAPFSPKEIEALWLRGGYPEPILQHDEQAYKEWMTNYRNTYINRDVAKLFPRLNKITYRRFLAILSKLSGTIINKREVARAIEVTEGTIREYLTIAEGTYLWRSLPSFEKNIIKSVIKMPKGFIRDSGLLHYLLGIETMEELYEHPISGASFESFVIEELLKGLEASFATNWEPYYYRTRAGAEIDLILDGAFGVLPIEIKQGSTVRMKQLIGLSQFVEEHQLPFGMVINQSETVEWLTDKIVQIPVGYL
jgi:predicted AAA+ superfamily ATPase